MSLIQWLRSKSAAKTEPKKRTFAADIDDELDYFCLRKGSLEGEIHWLEAPLSVSLFPEENASMDYGRSTQRLKAIAGDAEEWDRRLKTFAADQMADARGLIAVWGSEDTGEKPGEVTKEVFMQRIAPGFLWVYPDGSLYFNYDADGMFTDHAIGFTVDAQNRIQNCRLEG